MLVPSTSKTADEIAPDEILYTTGKRITTGMRIILSQIAPPAHCTTINTTVNLPIGLIVAIDYIKSVYPYQVQELIYKVYKV